MISENFITAFAKELNSFVSGIECDKCYIKENGNFKLCEKHHKEFKMHIMRLINAWGHMTKSLMDKLGIEFDIGIMAFMDNSDNDYYVAKYLSMRDKFANEMLHQIGSYAMDKLKKEDYAKYMDISCGINDEQLSKFDPQVKH